VALYLVTGGAGFIGSSAVRELLRRGERVRVVDNFFTGRRQNLEEVLADIDLRESDITDLPGLRPAFDGVDYVLHLAALPSVPRSVEDPVTSHRVNVDGTLNVLLAARDAKVRRLVYAASSSAYGDTPTLPKQESMEPNPVSPYGVTKLVGEYYARVFTRVYGLETTSVRYFNVFGPRQDPTSPYSGVLSVFISSLLAGRSPTIFGDGEQSRDFTYVDNAVAATLLACTAPAASGKVLNVAVGDRVTLNHVFAVLREITGASVEPTYGPSRKGDILHSLADIRAAREVLGYEPQVLLEEGLQRTVAWYKENRERFYAGKR
jgi:nucleoside-diphosphate-sugar epimerase